MSETPPNDKIMAALVNVGGAVAPAIHMLNEQQPPYICFFVSADSKKLIRERILPELKYSYEHYDWIETPAPQDLLACYQALVVNLPHILEKWGVSSAALGVEYTAGTKPMSVAAVLATIETTSQYFYVGSVDASGRTQGGIGVVLDNKEFTWFQTNPWDALAIVQRKEIALLFNHGRFRDAQDRAERLATVCQEDMRPIYTALAELIRGYAQWDLFGYKDAQAQLGRALKTLSPYVAGREDPIRFTLDVVARHVEFLGELSKKDERAAYLDVLDLVANADRRYRAHRYDDAVARLYSALEGVARNRLQTGYTIQTHKVAPESIPEPARADFVRRCGDPDHLQDGLRLGLQDSYLLLAELGDPLGKAYLENEKELNRVLQARNQSRLAHGTRPVDAGVYEALRAVLVRFAGIRDNDLPVFPEWRW